MRWEKHVACIGEVRSTVLFSSFEGHRPLENLGVVTVLKLVQEKLEDLRVECSTSSECLQWPKEEEIRK